MSWYVMMTNFPSLEGNLRKIQVGVFEANSLQQKLGHQLKLHKDPWFKIIFSYQPVLNLADRNINMYICHVRPSQLLTVFVCLFSSSSLYPIHWETSSTMVQPFLQKRGETVELRAPVVLGSGAKHLELEKFWNGDVQNLESLHVLNSGDCDKKVQSSVANNQ